MNEAAIKRSLNDLSDAITALPSARQGRAAQQAGVYESHSAGPERPVEEVLDQLRLQVKYLLFDLEATRRENRYLRQILEGRSGRDKDDSGENTSGF